MLRNTVTVINKYFITVRIFDLNSRLSYSNTILSYKQNTSLYLFFCTLNIWQSDKAKNNISLVKYSYVSQ